MAIEWVGKSTRARPMIKSCFGLRSRSATRSRPSFGGHVGPHPRRRKRLAHDAGLIHPLIFRRRSFTTVGTNLIEKYPLCESRGTGIWFFDNRWWGRAMPSCHFVHLILLSSGPKVPKSGPFKNEGIHEGQVHSGAYLRGGSVRPDRLRRR